MWHTNLNVMYPWTFLVMSIKSKWWLKNKNGPYPTASMQCTRPSKHSLKFQSTNYGYSFGSGEKIMITLRLKSISSEYYPEPKHPSPKSSTKTLEKKTGKCTQAKHANAQPNCTTLHLKIRPGPFRAILFGIVGGTSGEGGGLRTQKKHHFWGFPKTCKFSVGASLHAQIGGKKIWHNFLGLKNHSIFDSLKSQYLQ